MRKTEAEREAAIAEIVHQRQKPYNDLADEELMELMRRVYKLAEELDPTLRATVPALIAKRDEARPGVLGQDLAMFDVMDEIRSQLRELYSLLGREMFERYFTEVLSDPPTVAHVIAKGILRKAQAQKSEEDKQARP